MGRYNFQKFNDNSFLLSGAINMANARQIETNILEKISYSKSIHIILEDIDEFDSAILALMLSIQRYAVKNDIDLHFSIKQSNVEMLFKSHKLIELFTYLN